MSTPVSSSTNADDLWLRLHDRDRDADPVALRTTVAAASGAPSAAAVEARGPARASYPSADPSPGPSLAALAPTTLPDARDVQTRAALDEFRLSHVGWYHTPQGNVAVATPFLMVGERTKDFAKDTAHVAALQRIAAGANIDSGALARIQAGRGTASEIHHLTQALIDAQPPGTALAWNDVRALMWKNCIGIDCAGYTQRAYLHATGRTAAQAGFDVPMNEKLSGLARRGYVGTTSLEEVRSGDLVVFRPKEGNDPGHRAIVYDQHLATADDMQTLLSTSAGQSFALGGPVRVLEIDSSFGASGNPAWGGVLRQTWLHNETTGQWALEAFHEGTATLRRTPTLYDHPLEGFYRKKED